MTGSPAHRVLVVDDEENIRFLVGSALDLAGFVTAHAETGQEALDAVDSFGPDLVVLDVMLPDIDGFTVLQRLRDRGSSPKVIYLTARDTTEDRVRGLTTGGVDYQVKPGLPADDAARAFDRFFRTDQSRARRTGGSGLGLAIAKSIVEAHDGTITIDTSPAAGCQFFIALPRSTTGPVPPDSGSRPG